MADDAAGAVRRTPRPDRDELIEKAAAILHRESSGGGRSARGARALAEAGLLSDPEQRRPVVLLPAEDCTCTPPYADCLHGPEPVDALDLAVWLHAEALWQRDDARNQFLDHYNAASGTADRVGELEKALRDRTTERDQARVDAREWERVAKERNGTAQVMADLRDQAAAAEADRDAARSDREELRSERDEIAGELEDAQQHARNVTAQRDVEHRAHLAAATERDALQARLDAVRAVLDRPWPDDEDHHDFVNQQVEDARAALQGDQPAEPVKRCCIGPFADGTHAVNCWQRCQDCHGDETTCRCRVADQPAEPDSWESGAYIEPGIGGVANVSISGWPGGVERVWLRVSDYSRDNHGADIVLEPDEADEIAGVLRGAARAVRRDLAEPTGEVDRG